MVDFDGFHVGKYTNRPGRMVWEPQDFSKLGNVSKRPGPMRRVLQLQIWSILWRRGKGSKKTGGIFVCPPEFGELEGKKPMKNAEVFSIMVWLGGGFKCLGNISNLTIYYVSSGLG